MSIVSTIFNTHVSTVKQLLSVKKLFKTLAILFFAVSFSAPSNDGLIKDIFTFSPIAQAFAVDGSEFTNDPYILTISAGPTITIPTTNPNGTSVYFDKPTATISQSGIPIVNPLVTCSKESGSLFAIGATTVICSANNYFTGEVVSSSFTITISYIAPPTVTLSPFSPSSITAGQSSSISFSSTDATSCTASGLWNGNLGATSANNSSTGALNTPGAYSQSITCTGPGGSVTSGTSVLVVVAPTPAPTVTLNPFSPSTIYTGQSSSISFSSTDATSCVGSGLWNGNLGGTSAINASTGAINTAGNYSQVITCTSPGGSGTSLSRTLTVIEPAPTATISVSPSNISYGGASTISWGSTGNPSTCTALGAWSNSGALSGSGSTGGLSSSQTYSFYCTNSGGTSSVVSAIVNVCPVGTPIWNGSSCVAPIPTVTLNPFSPSTIYSGQTSSMSFTSTDATSCTATGVINGSVGTTNTLGTGALNTIGTFTQSVTCTGTGGTASSVSRTITVLTPPDVTAPVITVNGSNPASIVQGSIYTDAGATASDAVDGIRPVATTGTVNTAIVGSYIVTYSSSDLSGNTSAVTRTVNVVAVTPPADTLPPVIALNGSSTVQITVGGTYTELGAVALDTTDGSFAATATGTVNTALVGTYTVTYSAIDLAGNVATPVTRTVNVVAAPDVTAPVIILNGANPITIVVGSSYVDQGAVAFDLVDGTSTATSTGVVNNLLAGNYVITYGATDASGNVATPVTRTVHVVAVADVVPPVITVTGSNPLTIVASSTFVYVDLGAVTTDNVDGVGVATSTGTVDASTPGVYVITYGKTDSSGNVAVPVTRIVNVIPVPPTDTTAPVVTLNGGSVVQVLVGGVYTELGATAFDAVSGTTTVVITGTVDVNATSSYTITYTSTDAALNIGTITRTVNVVDVLVAGTLPPVISLNGSSTVQITVGGVYTELGAVALDVTDGSFAATPSGTVDTTTIGSYVVTYAATDVSGNVALPVTRTVNVVAVPVVSVVLITNSTINGTYYASFTPTVSQALALGITGTSTIINSTSTSPFTLDNVNLTNVIISSTTLAFTNATSTTFINSNLTGCTVINSFVKNYGAIGCSISNSIVDPLFGLNDLTGTTATSSEIIFSDVTYSTISGSYIATSTITSSTLTNSTSTNSTIATSTLTNANVNGSVITNSTLTASTATSSTIINSTIATSTTTNSTIATSTVNLSDIASSVLASSTLFTSSLSNSTSTNSVLTNSTSTDSTITTSTLINTDVSGAAVTNATLSSSSIASSTITNSTVTTSTALNSTIASSTVTLSDLVSSILASSTLFTSSLSNSTSTNSTLTNSTSTNTTFTNSSTTDTVFTNSTLTNVTTTNTSIANSTVENAILSSAVITNNQIISGTITANGTTTVVTSTTTLRDVINYTPVASFTTAITGLTTTLTDISTDLNSGSAITDIWTYIWNFGDGTTATTTGVTLGNNQTHSYALPGIYTILLTLIDSAMNTSTRTSLVTVTAPVIPPTTSGGGGSYSVSGGGYFVNTNNQPIQFTLVPETGSNTSTSSLSNTKTATSTIAKAKQATKKSAVAKKKPVVKKVTTVKAKATAIKSNQTLWSKIVSFFKKITIKE